MIINVEEQFNLRETLGEKRSKWGSKIAKVVERIEEIHEAEGDRTKAIVFVQWELVMAQLEKGLRAVGIEPLVLRGNLMQRQRVLSKFVDHSTSETSTLLLSLEQSPTGMNLVCAHHVLLVHPMYTEVSDEAVSYEMQAIGRVRRQGQLHTVHVHRFVSKGTVEESLARRHHAVCNSAMATSSTRRDAVATGRDPSS